MRGARQTTSKRFRREDFFESSPSITSGFFGYILFGDLEAIRSRTLSFPVHAAARASDLLPFFVSSKLGFIHVTGLTGGMVSHTWLSHGRAVLPWFARWYRLSLTARLSIFLVVVIAGPRCFDWVYFSAFTRIRGLSA